MPADTVHQTTPRVSVVVLSWNSARFLPGCFRGLARSRGVELEIIHVDNASADGSHELALAEPAVSIAVRAKENLGYSGGNNVGWRHATAPIVVFINPDCFVLEDTLAELVRPLLADPTIAITGARLYQPHSWTIQHAGGILHPNAMCEHHGFNQPDGPPWDQDADRDYVTGALVAIRREDLKTLGGFDEDYRPAYYEETDWCWRLRKMGRRIRYVAAARAHHYESPGLAKNSSRFVRTSYRSRIRFVLKNYTVGELLTKFLPFEWRWFWGPFAKGYRTAVLRSYVEGAVFAARCLLRFSRRPRHRDSDQAEVEVTDRRGQSAALTAPSSASSSVTSSGGSEPRAD